MKLTYKDLLLSLAIGFVTFVVLIVINFAIGNKLVFDNLGIQFFYTLLYTFTIGYVNKFIFVFLERLYVEERFSVKRILIGFLSSFVATLIVIFLLRIFKDVIIEKRSFGVFIAKESPANYIFAIAITFIVVLSFYAFYFYKIYSEKKVKEQKIIAGTANAKFESLKNQIDPHFLFNSLNVLSSLIEENPENAQRFTTSLSKIYRYVLEQKDKELVSVEEELAFAKTYMNLLKMRFENSLFYELPTTIPNPEAKVVPLSLQLLLENTVKHNVVSEQRPLHIRIFMEGDYLVIQNDYQKKEILQDRQGVGLQNIINRYGIITHRKVLIIQNNETFTVKIPILTKQISIMETATYNDNTAYYRAKKRVEQLKRVLRQLNFLLLRHTSFDFYQFNFFSAISVVLVFCCWLGIWTFDARFQGFWIQFQLGGTKNSRNFKKRGEQTELEIVEFNIETMENNHQDERYFKAKKRVEEIKGFYGNLAAYIVVNTGLLVVNLLTSPKHLWFYWPMIGWGIGVAIHGMKVFNYLPFLGKEWEEQKIKEFMDKEKANKETWK